MFNKKKEKNKIHQNNKAFSLIELMVTISIFAIISGVLFANFPKFGSKISLENMAYEIALSFKEAQTYGLSVKEFQGGFNSGYGLHFEATKPYSFILFADLNDNKKYNTNELVNKFNFQTKDKISNLCVQESGKAGDTCFLDSLDVSFKRPNPDANILGILGVSSFSNVDKIKIELLSPRGLKKSVVVWSTGQISVENTI